MILVNMDKQNWPTQLRMFIAEALSASICLTVGVVMGGCHV